MPEPEGARRRADFAKARSDATRRRSSSVRSPEESDGYSETAIRTLERQTDAPPLARRVVYRDSEEIGCLWRHLPKPPAPAFTVHVALRAACEMRRKGGARPPLGHRLG